MNLLYHVVFLFLLGGASCQNNRNAKPNSKLTKKTGSQSAELAPEVQPQSAAGGVDPGKQSGTNGRGGPQQAAALPKPSDLMKLHFLKNTQVTCNDGTAAG